MTKRDKKRKKEKEEIVNLAFIESKQLKCATFIKLQNVYLFHYMFSRNISISMNSPFINMYPVYSLS
jgi:hypothetical protein